MSEEKIQCPKWLQDPIKYNAAKEFSLQDWHGQIATRQVMSLKIDNGTCEYDINDKFQNGIVIDNANTIISTLESVDRRASFSSNNEFREFGLMSSNVWSQTTAEVEIRNKINKTVQDKHGYITDDYPSKICEQLANHDKDYRGIATVNVDLFQDEKQLFKEFRLWVKNAKHFYNYGSMELVKPNKWAEYRALAYWDLMMWIKQNGYTCGSGKQITLAEIQRWLFGGHKYHEPNLKAIKAAKKYYKAIKEPYMLEVLISRSLCSSNKEKYTKTNIKDFMKSKGYKPQSS